MTEKLAVKFYLTRVRLNAGGYNSNGCYFGNDLPLYFYSDGDGYCCDHIRAANREEAKAEIRRRHRVEFPEIRFFR